MARFVFFILFLTLTWGVKGQNFAQTADSLVSVAVEQAVAPIPLPDVIDDGKAVRLDLNGSWLFNVTPQPKFEVLSSPEKFKNWTSIKVPSEWYMEGFDVPKDQYAGYVRFFNLPNSWKSQRVFIRFGAVQSTCKIFLNGGFVGEHTGSMTQFEFELTPWIKRGRNQLSLYVKSESLGEVTAKISHYAQHPVGGILRNVTLYTLPITYIKDFAQSYKFSDSRDTVYLKTGVTLPNLDKRNDTSRYSVQFTLTYKGEYADANIDDTLFCRKVQVVDGKKAEVMIELNHPYLWHPEAPHLYTLQSKLFKDGKPVEITHRHIGFRDIEIKGNVMYLNGKPIKLYGVALHELWAYQGRALPDSAAVRDDVLRFKQGNCNYIRTAHYPKDNYFMDLCDLYGILVEDEAPVCWLWDNNPSCDVKETLSHTFASLLMRDRYHPSVVCWSIANESAWSEIFDRCYFIAKHLAPGIPIKFSHSEYFGINERLDVGSRHYPGWKGYMKYRNYYRPIFFDEALHVNAYNTTEYFTDPGIRDLWGDYINYAIDEIDDAPAIAGIGIWSAVDEMFYPKKHNPIGSGPWGVFDAFRREKPEYWHMKMAYSPVQLMNKMFTIQDGNTNVVVKNRYAITDLNQLDITWKADGKQGYLRVQGAPQSLATIQVPYAIQGDTLELAFTDRMGIEVFRCITVRTLREKVMPLLRIQGRPSYTTDSLLKRISIKSVNGTIFTLSQETGLLESVTLSNGQQVVKGPYLYLVPLSKANEAIDFIPTGEKDKGGFLSPHLEHWICNQFNIEEKEAMLRFTVQGRYDSIPVRYVYQINASGQIRIDYTANLGKSKTAHLRQIGIGLDLSESYNHLSWHKDGLWTVYPKNHIGRLQGEAVLHTNYELGEAIGKNELPTWDYNLDNSPYGSTDFRSTKHHIYEATLSQERGIYPIKVESNGEQHLRVWKSDGHIHLLLANYSNGGNEHYLSYDSYRTRIPDEEMLLDGGDVRGWIQLDFNHDQIK